MANMNIQHTKVPGSLACAFPFLDFLDSAGFGDFGHWDRRTSGLQSAGLGLAGLVLAGYIVHTMLF